MTIEDTKREIVVKTLNMIADRIDPQHPAKTLRSGAYCETNEDDMEDIASEIRKMAEEWTESVVLGTVEARMEEQT